MSRQTTFQKKRKGKHDRFFEEKVELCRQIKSIMETIVLNGQSLDIESVYKIAHRQATVRLCPTAMQAVKRSSDFVQAQVKEKRVIYGVTTGFGANAAKVINDYEQAQALQRNLLLSHATGIGAPFDEATSRAIMLIRLNTLMAGHSGIRPLVLERLAFMLNAGAYPVIPSQGSVGASGDLCPLAHMALPLIGEGEVIWKGQRLQAKEWLSMQGLAPLELWHKEGIALLNGTTVMNAIGALTVMEAERLFLLACLTAAVCFEALCARTQAFDPRIHHLRRHQGQQYTAALIRAATEGSRLMGLQPGDLLKALPAELWQHIEQAPAVAGQLKRLMEGKIEPFPQDVYRLLPLREQQPSWKQWRNIFSIIEKKISPQDAYSVRCTPQVLGASIEAIQHVRTVVEQELNAVVDNPLLFVDEGDALSGGNFHGQPLALALDYLKIALCEIGNLLERQINKLVDEHTNDGLPAFLVEDTSGLHSGLMIPQYAAAALVSENKVLAHPASVDSIPTCANQEDHVSMGTIAARQAAEILQNVKKIVCIHLLCSTQALDLRIRQLGDLLPVQTGKGSAWLHEKLRHHVPFVSEDRFLHRDLQTIERLYEELTAQAQAFFGEIGQA